MEQENEEMEFAAAMSTDGRITIPQEVRLALGLSPGDIVRIKVIKTGIRQKHPRRKRR